MRKSDALDFWDWSYELVDKKKKKTVLVVLTYTYSDVSRGHF
jgi:hypothetical protein